MSFETFVPDLLVGVLTGIAVGVVFILYERSMASKRTEEEARLHSSRLVHPLLLAVQRLDEPNYESVSSLPRRVERALTLVEASDLDRWHELAESPLIVNLLKFRGAAWDLREDARDLEVAIQRWKRLHETMPGTAEFGTAELLGAPIQYLVELAPDKDRRRALSEQAQTFRDSKLVKKHARHYRKGLARTGRALDSLQVELVSAVRAEKGDRSVRSEAHADD